jgi:hypothetical protein
MDCARPRQNADSIGKSFAQAILEERYGIEILAPNVAPSLFSEQSAESTEDRVGEARRHAVF